MKKTLKACYVLPFSLAMQEIGIDSRAIPDQISLTRDDLERLLKGLLRAVEFDEEWYRSTYPDVDDAIRRGAYQTAKHHFVENGYFEGRRPGKVIVDEDWYKKAYPDIAEAIEFGEIASCQDHFDHHGEAEGRLPRQAGL